MSSNYSDTQLGKKAVEQANATSAPGLRLAEVMSDMSKLEGGSPSVYKLRMNEEMRHTEGMIARKSLGTPDRIGLGETEKVFMVVGETGAGKTTLINGMINYILGVQWKDEFRFKGITEETKAAQAYSQTQGITAYTFYPMKGSAVPYTFTVIDTPGYGGTEGLERDKKITKQIKDCFSLGPPHGIDHLNGVGFVVQAARPRLTATQVYIFDSILEIFGNDVSENIFMMITFADNQRPPVLDAIKELPKVPSHSEKLFKFNNSALFAENDAEEYETSFDELFWKMCLGSFSNFFEEFRKAESVSLTLTREVLEEREQLHVLIEGLNVQITLGLNKLEEMRQEEIVMQQREKEIDEKMMKATEEYLQAVHTQVLHMIKRAQQSLSRLDEIALKPNPLTYVEYLELLIESEKKEAKPGWKQRIQYLELAKRHAEILSKVKDQKEIQKLVKRLSKDKDVSEEALEKLSLGGDNWYSRFRFW